MVKWPVICTLISDQEGHILEDLLRLLAFPTLDMARIIKAARAKGCSLATETEQNDRLGLYPSRAPLKNLTERRVPVAIYVSTNPQVVGTFAGLVHTACSFTKSPELEHPDIEDITD
jgi:hypothetical protein